MDDPPLSCLAQASDLERLSQLVVNSPSAWNDVELVAHNLANCLRIKDGPEDNHTALGNTSLPQTLTSLLRGALGGNPIPDDAHTVVVFEIFRVAANFCMDHDENRGHLLEAGFPQAIVSLLEGYSESLVPALQREPLPLTIPHLKVIKTAVGVLLNASINFDPVKFRLISLEAAVTIMKLSIAIYPPGSWAIPTEKSASVESSDFQANIIESWTLRCGLSNWAWRTISELKDVKDESRQIFGPDVLPLLIPPLLAFIPPFTEPSSTSAFANDSPLRVSLLQTDFDILEESCMLIESLSLDIEDVRLSLARGLNFPAEHSGVPCLCAMLDFIEKGDYHPLWHADSEEAERKRRERLFDVCKAAIIKVVVEVAGEEKNEEVLWDDSEEGKPGGEFVYRMVAWIKNYVAGKTDGTEQANADSTTGSRDDLVICASLSLGNLARREQHAVTLLSPPHSLAPVLVSPHLLSPSADIKLKHGILALLKHLAQSASQSTSIHATLTESGVVQRVTASGVWDERTDAMAEVVQVSAIGVVKHLCNANVENTFALVIPAPNQEPASTGLSQILDLVRRSESVPVKSEGTRVLVNIIKSLWSGSLVTGRPTGVDENRNDVVASEVQRKRNAAMQLVLKPQSVQALASLVSRSGKYPVLVNEGVVALSLLSTHKEGAMLVANTIVAPLPLEMTSGTVSSPVSASTSSEVSSPVVISPTTRTRLPMPRRALDMLIAVLKNVDTGSNFPVEIRVNVCSLILQIGKNASNTQFAKIKETTRPVFEDLAEGARSTEGKTGMLGIAAQKVLDAWA